MKRRHHLIATAKEHKAFEREFVSLWQKKGRHYPDEEFLRLPFITKHHRLKILKPACITLLAHFTEHKLLFILT